VWIINPSVVSEVPGGWKLQRKGLLEVRNHNPDNSLRKAPPLNDLSKKPAPASVEENPKVPLVLEEFSEKHSSRRWLSIAAIVSILLAVAVTSFWLKPVFRPLPTQIESSNDSLTQPPMLSIPGGVFEMGANSGDDYERPQHTVTVTPFLIDTYEVTCGDYERFLKANPEYKSPPGWVNRTAPPGTVQRPVTGVHWYDASAYANWAGKRLPTEEEWEFAARGTTGWRYPWGNDWRADAANAGDSNARQFADVGSYPAGKGPFGTMDMIGNAWEWTSTEWKGYPGGPVPPDAPNELRVIRGGYWGSSAAKATTTFRRGWDARGAKTGYENTGFRCAADVNAQTSQK
jgi:formylglycine-generating enzyme required for sulfatase activity